VGQMWRPKTSGFRCSSNSIFRASSSVHLIGRCGKIVHRVLSALMFHNQ
jgi:hypothetical protein